MVTTDAILSEAKNEEGAQAKRPGVLSWDDYFMSVAFLTGMRSKDPATQVGACIVNDLNRIIGVGYNGWPSGIPEGALPWAKWPSAGSSKSDSEAALETKHPYVVHAEVNAVMNKNAESCRGCRIYTTLHPCNECAKVIIQAGIREVIYASDKHHHKPTSRASRELFRLAAVTTRHHAPETPSLHVYLRYPEDEPGPEPTTSHRTTEDSLAGLCQECCPDAALRFQAMLPQEAARAESRFASIWRAVGLPLACSAVVLLVTWRRMRGL
eukprot:CAMPEP_0171086818 /NCGR_PEP_ID=MMETSP0766_2-20121228/19778_1 /TAXON_ID=439317 /ORGANISM="Gambierdiscus australes, Strain CAWD 149" /LENGTH=267 /DNA_ID=CAMNT_0011544487 /DNA_START=57 /DNA_END=860 /DNA_ORIENTATION=+